MADNNMKVQVDNPLNRPMHNGNGQLITGVLPAPNALPYQVLYSGYEQSQIYNGMVRDLYQHQKSASPKKKGMPTIIKIILGVLGAMALYAVVKPSAVKLFNKIFHRG